MKRKAWIAAIISILAFSVVWFWPAFHQPADRTCSADSEDYWSYKVGSRQWNCYATGWHITVRGSTYGFGGI